MHAVGLFALLFALIVNVVIVEKLWKTLLKDLNIAFLHVHSILPDVAMVFTTASKLSVKYADKTN